MAQPVTTQQRWSTRLPLELDVALYGEGARVLAARTRNISLGGMFVQTFEPLFLDAMVVTAFGFRNQDDRAYYRLPATVVRAAEDGVGLMFNRFDVETVRSLRQALYFADRGYAADAPHEVKTITIQL